MPATDKFFAINIRKYLALGDDQEAGEPALVKLLSGFSCPKNVWHSHFDGWLAGKAKESGAEVRDGVVALSCTEKVRCWCSHGTFR